MISVINDLGKHIEKTYGKRGTPERDKFEKELDKIYLQKEEGTWCEDRINDDDVEYMRVEQDCKELKQKSDDNTCVDWCLKHDIPDPECSIECPDIPKEINNWEKEFDNLLGARKTIHLGSPQEVLDRQFISEKEIGKWKQFIKYLLKQEKLDLLNRLSYLVDGGMYLEFAIERIQKEIKEDKQ